MNKKILRSIVGLIILINFRAVSAQPIEEQQILPHPQKILASTIMVTSNADSGPGTLRQAMSDAVQGDTILFDPVAFPPASRDSIILTSGVLPSMTQGNLTIDASNAGVILDGKYFSGSNGFTILSDSNCIKGFQIQNFSEGAGIQIENDASDNFIGGDSLASF